ncbi:aromatic ring-hydroxylating dioxygenase subunit alpha [Novosphingobium sp. MMS21-SN21R]|uniref:aromatic ring-hydroxylating dioxygenase subunit alpha n=1 Tax=Novosphingobium sp. MMS21-SN21R TaxID=2969298 RepID=UPI00288463A5|nr:aromatic ring-hydroxylating dioxygenase subunit alpha [Novosphingobium sp. MMS21-SN21R]MDT0509784.1 aromatic ring-hydroxylating dioxygenase subunit alpha [Novosphingobium sp. MMS21-SN21R]
MPFLKNTWYVAASAGELDAPMVSRTICNQPIVLFRNSDGTPAAIHDRCPHRFVPLSMGKRVGDTIQCGYHGLAFDGTGACVDAPHDDDSQKARACIKGYAVAEKHKWIWIWMGEAADANPDLIPDFGFFDEEDTIACCQGYTHMKGNYQLISDNLLDLSHIHYLHPEVHQGSNFEDFTNKVKRDGDTVYSMLYRHHYHIDAAKRGMFGLGEGPEDVEGQGHSRWDVPGVLFVDTAFWDHGKTIDEGYRTPNAHLITPETETSSHYFWGSGRTYMLDVPQVTEMAAAVMKNVFETQDGPMIEAQQRDMGESTDFLNHKPIILKADAAGVMARRIMQQKIRAEAGETILQDAAE